MIDITVHNNRTVITFLILSTNVR